MYRSPKKNVIDMTMMITMRVTSLGSYYVQVLNPHFVSLIIALYVNEPTGRGNNLDPSAQAISCKQVYKAGPLPESRTHLCI